MILNMFYSKDNIAIHSNSEIQISLTQLCLYIMQDIIELSFGMVSGSSKANIDLVLYLLIFSLFFQSSLSHITLSLSLIESYQQLIMDINFNELDCHLSLREGLGK